MELIPPVLRTTALSHLLYRLAQIITGIFIFCQFIFLRESVYRIRLDEAHKATSERNDIRTEERKRKMSR